MSMEKGIAAFCRDAFVSINVFLSYTSISVEYGHSVM